MSEDSFFYGPAFCYIMDGILMVYCLIVTAFFFREKFCFLPPAVEPAVEPAEENGRIYQELNTARDADPYQVLEPSKRKKRAAKKKKPKPTRDEQRDTDPNESLTTQDSAPPLPLH